MNPQLIADLEAARALIDSPEKWAKDTLREYRHGIPCKWCALGAVIQTLERSSPSREHETVRALEGVIGTYLVSWNDAPERTHAEVLAAFDRAIANERSKA